MGGPHEGGNYVACVMSQAQCLTQDGAHEPTLSISQHKLVLDRLGGGNVVLNWMDIFDVEVTDAQLVTFIPHNTKLQ